MKFLAGAILTVIISPIFIWAGSTLLAHDRYISADRSSKETTRQIVIEIQKDMRDVRNHLMGVKSESLRDKNPTK